MIAQPTTGKISLRCVVGRVITDPFFLPQKGHDSCDQLISSLSARIIGEWLEHAPKYMAELKKIRLVTFFCPDGHGIQHPQHPAGPAVNSTGACPCHSALPRKLGRYPSFARPGDLL